MHTATQQVDLTLSETYNLDPIAMFAVTTKIQCEYLYSRLKYSLTANSYTITHF
jgi:hypothetical protein